MRLFGFAASGAAFDSRYSAGKGDQESSSLNAASSNFWSMLERCSCQGGCCFKAAQAGGSAALLVQTAMQQGTSHAVSSAGMHAGLPNRTQMCHSLC